MPNYELFKEIEASTSNYIIVPKHILLELLKLSEIKNDLLTTNKDDTILKPTFDIKEKIDQLSEGSPTLKNDIKFIRKQLGITQDELANEAKMKQPDISDFENLKDKNFEAERRIRIIEALKNLSTTPKKNRRKKPRLRTIRN